MAASNILLHLCGIVTGCCILILHILKLLDNEFFYSYTVYSCCVIIKSFIY